MLGSVIFNRLSTAVLTPGCCALVGDVRPSDYTSRASPASRHQSLSINGSRQRSGKRQISTLTFAGTAHSRISSRSILEQ